MRNGKIALDACHALNAGRQVVFVVMMGMLCASGVAFAEDTPQATAAPQAGFAPVATSSAVESVPAPTPGLKQPVDTSATASSAGLLAVPAEAAAEQESHHDLSVEGMFMAADPVVKGVMLLLAAGSVVTWAVLFLKLANLMLARWRLRKTIRILSSARSLSECAGRLPRGTGALLLHQALDERALSQGLCAEGIKERVCVALQRVEASESRRMAMGTGLLASVGSVGPFVGLFGTVWGIMRSFIGIANSNTTNLAVVAPGIAEALLATGVGLVAAIPAVVIYNALSRMIGGYRAMISDAAALIIRHVSRDLDRDEARINELAPVGLRMAAE